MNVNIKAALACGLALFSLSASADDGGRELVVIYTGDSGAEVESCGCNLLAYGGLARRASLVNLLRLNYPDAVFVDTGDFVSPNVGEQDRLKSEITAEAYGAFGYDAINVGEDEFNFGLDFFTDLVEKHGLPVISANIRLAGEPLAPTHVLINRGGLRVGVVGFLNAEVAASKDLGPVKVEPYKKALKKAVHALAARADVIICLAHIGNVEKAREFTGYCPQEIDVVLAGHRGGRTPRPEKIKGRWMVYTRSRNRYVGMLKLTLDGKNDVVAVENHLLPVTKETAKEETTQALVEKYYEALRKLVEEKKLLKPPEDIPTAGFIYVGSSRCAACHASQRNRWHGTSHATAYESLEAVGRERDPECVACHVTGYGYRGGYDGASSRRPRQVGVGCEECHGPGEGHANSPALLPPPVTEENCTRCHDLERSPSFDFAPYSEAIKH